jgi:hypothetical protein
MHAYIINYGFTYFNACDTHEFSCTVEVLYGAPTQIAIHLSKHRNGHNERANRVRLFMSFIVTSK